MATLDRISPGTHVCVRSIQGNIRLLTRLSSVGIVPGSMVKVERNDARRPVLVYERDTLLALNREEAGRIEVEEVV